MPVRLDPSSRNEMPIVPMDAPRIAPLGIAAPADTIESMAAPAESASGCLTNLLQCLASPFIALWNWLFGGCCSSDTSALTDPLDQRFNRLYNLFLNQAVRLEWREAIIVSKDGQTIFFQLEKKSHNTVDNSKNQTIQRLRAAIGNQMSDATCEITMIFVEKNSDNERYSVSHFKDASIGSTIDMDQYVMEGATQTRVKEAIDHFSQEEVEALTEFFFRD